MDVNLDTLAEARQYEEIRIVGYKTMLSFPESVLDSEGRAEINEALAWSNNRLTAINAAYSAIDALLADGYPDRVQQIAAAGVIEQFDRSLAALQLAVDEFAEPPTGSLEVGEEMPV